jgi:hypothetical protein
LEIFFHFTYGVNWIQEGILNTSKSGIVSALRLILIPEKDNKNPKQMIKRWKLVNVTGNWMSKEIAYVVNIKWEIRNTEILRYPQAECGGVCL